VVRCSSMDVGWGRLSLRMTNVLVEMGRAKEERLMRREIDEERERRGKEKRERREREEREKTEREDGRESETARRLQRTEDNRKKPESVGLMQWPRWLTGPAP